MGVTESLNGRKYKKKLIKKYIYIAPILLLSPIGERKSKRAGKYGTKKRKECREEPLGTMSYQTSSKLSPSFWFLIGARKLLCFSAQSEGRMAATVWNWSVKTLSPGALLAILYFSSCHIFPPV